MRNEIVIKGYRGDNEVCKSNLFKQSCESMNQILDFCGVGAHHHIMMLLREQLEPS